MRRQLEGKQLCSGDTSGIYQSALRLLWSYCKREPLATKYIRVP